jgi:hypothetical protein
MNELIKIIAADRITRLSTIIALGLIFATVIYIALFYRDLPPYLPLFNQLSWGDPRLGEKIFIFLLPLVTLFILIGNTIFASFLYSTLPLVSRMLTITSLLVSSLTLIFIIRVTQLLL